MPLLVPRLQLNPETIREIQGMAARRGISVGDVIAALVEQSLAAGSREVLFRILLSGERHGLAVNGTNAFPEAWTRIGGLDPAVCRELAAEYQAWKQKTHGTVST